MAKIKVHDLKLTGFELFDDSESFMNELNSDELGQAMGGLVWFPTRTINISLLFPRTIVIDIIPKTPFPSISPVEL